MCGIFGIYSEKLNVAEATYFGLFALQHRGQESVGIATADGENVTLIKRLGLVSQAFNSELLSQLKGHLAVGHVRYSTTGHSDLTNAQPVEFYFQGEKIILAHNGNLVNIPELNELCKAKGVELKGTADTELIAALVSVSDKESLESAILELMPVLKGAYSLLFLARDRMIGVRDPLGIRPMSLGRLEQGLVMSSEDCAFSVVGATLDREVMPGEVLTVTAKGTYSLTSLSNSNRLGICAFEFIYFARPDSSIKNKNLYETRVKMGRNLYREHPVQADAVMSVPDSGTPAAIGFSKESGIPFAEGLIKNRYIGRTFIQPEQLLREVGVRLKLNPIVPAIKGKRIVVVDDSIVRGTTSKKIVKLLRNAGAKEIHFRVSSPQVMSPCFYGIDTATKKELIAATMSLEEIRKELGVDSIGYLSLKGLKNAIHLPENHMCLGCFNGDYPIPAPEQLQREKLYLGSQETI